MEGRVNVYRVATHTKFCLYVCVCVWNNGSDYLFFFYFSDWYTSVLFVGYIESMSCFVLFFFVNHLLGLVATWVDFYF